MATQYIEIRREKYPLQLLLAMLAKGGAKKRLANFAEQWLRDNKYRGCTGEKAYLAYLTWRKNYENKQRRKN